MNKLKAFIEKYKSSDLIFKATIWFVLVTVIDNGISVITQPFVNRILSVEQVGAFNVFSTWSTLLRIVTTFNLYCGVYEVFLVDHKEDQEQLRGSLCVLSTLFMFVTFGLIFLFIHPIAAQLQLKPVYLVAMFFLILSEAIIQFYIVPLRFNYNYVRYSVFVVALFFCKSLLTILLSYLLSADRVLGRILGLTLPSFLVAMVLLVVILKKTSRRSLTKYWKQSIKFNLPLIPHYLSSVVLASSDKVMIQRLAGDFYVGLYSVAFTYSNLSNIVFTAINNSYTPWALNAIKEKDYPSLKKRTNAIILISVLFCIALMLFAPEGISILGGGEYLQALHAVPMLIAGTFLSTFYFIFSNVEFVNKKTKLVFPITITGAGINILLNWLLIPRIGYAAAAYTTFVGYLIIGTCHYLYSRKIAQENVFDLKFILAMLLLLVAGAMGSLLIYQLHFLIRYLLALLLCVSTLALFIRFRKKKSAPEAA